MSTIKPALTLIGLPQSTCTTRLLLVFLEKGLEFSLYTPDLANGELKGTSHIKKHPFGMVPVLEDEDFRLFESRAIARYLAIKHVNCGTSLVPPLGDTKAWAVFEQWASVELSHFDPFATTIYIHNYLNPLRGNPSDEAAVAAARKALTQKLDVLDRILSEQAYMAGQTFSLVDIFYMPTINGLFRAGEAQLIMARPYLDDWWNRLTERPSWKKVVEVYHAK